MLSLRRYFMFCGQAKIYFGGLLLLIFLPFRMEAIESFPRDSTHRGIVELSPYQIYPENRLGNGLYLDKNLLASHPQRTILNTAAIKNTKSFVYLYRNQNEVLELGVVNAPEDGEGSLQQVGAEFYQYTNRTLGLQRIFRIFQGQIKPLLPNIRTGAGVSVSPTHAIFYHITDSQKITRINEVGEEEVEVTVTFRLHLINRKLAGVVSLFRLPVEDAKYRLKLVWEDEDTVSYKSSDGEKHLIDLQKYAPRLF